MATLTENVKRIVDALDDTRAAIIRKGQTPDGRCETFADAIDNISTGTDVSDTTAIPSKVLQGEVFYDADGTRSQGMMTNNGAMNLRATPGVPAAIPEGYYNGNGILVSDGVIVGEVDAIPSDVLAGKKFYGNSDRGYNANLVGTMTDFGRISINEALDKNKKGISKGYLEGHHSSVGVIVGVDSQNVEQSITQNGHYDIGSDMTSFIENVSLDVNVPSPPTQSKTVQPQSVQQTVYPDAGYLLSSVVVGAAAVGRKIASGTFTGTSGVTHTEYLDFTPSVVLVYNDALKTLPNIIIYANDVNCAIGYNPYSQPIKPAVAANSTSYGSVSVNGNTILIVPYIQKTGTGSNQYNWIAIE